MINCNLHLFLLKIRGIREKNEVKFKIVVIMLVFI
jgi:hypothetical protein